MSAYTTGTPFQLIWNDGHTDMLLEVPVAGANVLVTKHPLNPNSGTNAWMQKRENGRLYLLDTAGKPTSFCLDVNLPDQHEVDGVFPDGSGCLVYLNTDIPQRQTQLWQITDRGDGTCFVQNIGLSLSIQFGPGAGPYVLDSGGNNQQGGAAKLWKKDPGNRNQYWQLRACRT